MKKLLLSLLVVAFMLIGAASFANTATADILPEASAAEIINSGTCGENLTWTLDDEGTLVVSGSGAVDSTISQALSDRKDDVKKVIIGSEITEVGYSAFFQFYSLEEVEFGKDSMLEYIAYGAFHGAPLKKITIPASVKEIGKYAFRAAVTMTEVSFEKGSQLEIIGEEAFFGAGITNITIPASVTEIGEAAFASCDQLVKVEFEENSKLTELGSTTAEGEQHPYFCGIFSFCNSLETIILPENLEVLGNCVFANCDSLVTVNLEALTELKSIGEETFVSCELLKKVILPESVETIKKEAFAGCDVLEGVEIVGDSKLTYIGEEVFSDCIGMKEFRIPEGVIYIGDNAFSWTRLKEINIPESVTCFGTINGPYTGKFTVDPDNTCYSSDEYGALYNKDKTVLLAYPTGTRTKEYVIPDGVEIISPYTFAFDGDLERVVMPDSVKEIQEYAFSYNFSIRELVMSKNVETIGEGAFVICMRLEHLEIPAGVDTIGEYACEYMYSLKDIKIYNKKLDISESGLGVLEFYCDKSETEEFIDVFCDAQYYSLSADEEYVLGKYNSVDELMALFNGYLENDEVIVKDHYTVYCYRDSAAEPYLKENGIKYAYLCDHEEEIIPAVAATCTSTGLTEGVKCSLCGEILVAPEKEPMTGHKTQTVDAREPEIGVPGYTGDTVCSVCGDVLERGEEIPALEDDTVPECDHICHKDGVLGILWRIISFFAKLFKVNPVCECGAAHY